MKKLSRNQLGLPLALVLALASLSPATVDAAPPYWVGNVLYLPLYDSGRDRVTENFLNFADDKVVNVYFINVRPEDICHVTAQFRADKRFKNKPRSVEFQHGDLVLLNRAHKQRGNYAGNLKYKWGNTREFLQRNPGATLAVVFHN